MYIRHVSLRFFLSATDYDHLTSQHDLMPRVNLAFGFFFFSFLEYSDCICLDHGCLFCYLRFSPIHTSLLLSCGMYLERIYEIAERCLSRGEENSLQLLPPPFFLHNYETS